MSDATYQEKIIEGLENGDIEFADPGVTVQTITIAQYAVVRQRGLELLQSTDFSIFADGVPADSFAPGTPQCDIDEAIATFAAYARGDYSPQINATTSALALVSGFSPDTPLLAALAQTEDTPYIPYLGPDNPNTPSGPVAPTDPVDPVDPTDPVAPTEPSDPVAPTEPTGPETPSTTPTGGDDALIGSSEDDVIKGRGGDDTLTGGGGDDRLLGGGGADRIKGSAGDDTLKGGGGDDNVKGGGGADDIKGGGGADTLKGGGGDDKITGGRGDDVLNGGGGADTFVFTGAFGSDQINRFAVGTDKLAIRQADGFEDLDIQDVAGGVRIAFGNGDILLKGRSESDLSESDFLF